MADRVIRTRFAADVEGYRQAVRNAAKTTQDFGRDVGNTLQSTSAKTQRSMDAMGKTALLAGGAMLAGFALATNAVIGFDKQMSEVGAVADATADDLGKLRDAAIEAGQATVFSASDAAKAEAELAKAGVSTQDILAGGLTGALNLASAGSLQLGEAATFAANAMNTFGLEGSDVERIADTLAAGANKSAADVKDIGQALQQSGLVADQFGLSMEETVGVLASFAQAGLRGSDAGTSFKTALQRLIPQSAEAAETMQRLGLHFFDAQGKFVGIAGAAGQLKGALANLTDEQKANALQTIFGQDAIRAATILYQEGASGVNEWTTKVTDSGYAAEVAAKKMDNLAGDLENLQGSLETALIKGGSQATGALRFITQETTNLVNGFSQMPDALQAVTVGFAALAGGGLAVLGLIGTFAPKIQQAKEALDQMGASGQALSRNLGKVGSAVGALGVAFAGLTVVQSQLAGWRQEGETWAQSVTKNIDPMKLTFAEAEAAIGRLKKGAEDLRADQSDDWQFWDADRNAALAAGANELTGFGNEMITTQNAARKLASELGINVEVARKLILEHDDLKTVTAAGTIEFDKMAASTALLTDSLKAQADTIKATVDPFFAVLDALDSNQAAQRAVAEAQKDLNDAYKSGTATADELAAKQQAVTDANFAAVKSAEGVSVSLVNLASAVAGGTISIESARQQLQGWVEQGLITQEQADMVGGRFDLVGIKAGELSSTVDQMNATGLNMNVTAPGLDKALETARALKEIADYLANFNIGSNEAGAYYLPPGEQGPVLPLPQGPVPGDAAQAPSRTYSYAAGGIVTSPHVATVGEGGMLEAIIPAKGDPTRSMGLLSTAASWWGMQLTPANAYGGTVNSGHTYQDNSRIEVVSRGDLAADLRAVARERDWQRVKQSTGRW